MEGRALNYNTRQKLPNFSNKTSKKKKIIKIVKEMEKAFKEKGDPITSYRFNSYYGAGGRNHHEDPAYIDYRTKAIDQFGKDMSSGKYGRLD